MESYRGQKEFEEQLLRGVKTFVTKNFKEAELQQKEELDNTFDKIFFRTLKTHRLLVEISDITGIKGENVEIIAKSILRFAFKEQYNNVQKIGKQNSRLRSWLRQAQQENSTHDTKLNAEIDSELKHQSGASWNKEKVKKAKNVKKIKNRLVKEIVLPQNADQALSPGEQSTRSCDMLFYDIPARYNEIEVCNAIKQLGMVHSVIDIRWFHGNKTVKEIKEKCKWKAYKVIQTNYYQDVARNNYTFEYGKTAHFGNKTVFLAYFKDKEQLEAAIAMDKSILNKWVIHGKRPEKEVVDTVNKYRKNLLNETEPQGPPTVSMPIKDYASPEKVVKIIEEYRGEHFVEHNLAPTNEGILIDLSEKVEISFDYNIKDLFKDNSDSQMKKEKTVSPVELHEFAKVNAECSERLQKERERPYTYSNNNPFLIEEDVKSTLSESSDDDECIKYVKKRIKKKQGARSSDSEEDLTINSSNEETVKQKLQSETKINTNKINKTPPEGFSRVFRKGRSRIKK
ncbi:unnamed protein product [Rhizophagus irregularis]|nr:unnamed protein product [Rhizophagus irregularis]